MCWSHQGLQLVHEVLFQTISQTSPLVTKQSPRCQCFLFSPFSFFFRMGYSLADPMPATSLNYTTNDSTYPFASCNLKYQTSDESLLTFRPLLSDRHTPYKCISGKGTSCPKKRATFMPIYPKHRVQVSRSPTYPETTTRTQVSWPNSENRNKATNCIYKIR
jgi:hypothetical protein